MAALFDVHYLLTHYNVLYFDMQTSALLAQSYSVKVWNNACIVS